MSLDYLKIKNKWYLFYIHTYFHNVYMHIYIHTFVPNYKIIYLLFKMKKIWLSNMVVKLVFVYANIMNYTCGYSAR